MTCQRDMLRISTDIRLLARVLAAVSIMGPVHGEEGSTSHSWVSRTPLSAGSLFYIPRWHPSCLRDALGLQRPLVTQKTRRNITMGTSRQTALRWGTPVSTCLVFSMGWTGY